VNTFLKNQTQIINEKKTDWIKEKTKQENEKRHVNTDLETNIRKRTERIGLLDVKYVIFLTSIKLGLKITIKQSNIYRR
jgi:hypothetical protein